MIWYIIIYCLNFVLEVNFKQKYQNESKFIKTRILIYLVFLAKIEPVEQWDFGKKPGKSGFVGGPLQKLVKNGYFSDFTKIMNKMSNLSRIGKITIFNEFL